MNAELPAYLLLLPLLVIPLISLALSSRKRNGHLRLPPGPWALPVIGHLHHLAGAPPHRALRDLARRHGPLMLLRFCELPVVVASSPEAAREIMKVNDVSFASRPIGPILRRAFRGAEGLVFAPYGDGWRQLRKISTLELLSSRRVRSFRPVREEELGRLLGSVASAAAAGTSVNLTERIKAFVSDSAVHAIIGSRSEHRDEFLRLMEEALRVIPGLSLPDLFPSSRLAMLFSSVPRSIERRRRAILDIIDPIIQAHQDKIRGGGGVDEEEDLLDVLLRLQKDMDGRHPLTTANITAVIIDMFFAGSETSATALQWAMAELMRNPAVMRKAQDEVRSALAGHDNRVTENSLTNLHYLHLIVKETLRLHPPAPLLLPRECRDPCRVLGYDVPRGAMVLVNAWAIGRDPEHWDAPEDFVPERFERSGRDFKGMDFEFIPFGAGRRICPGMAFGLAHVELLLAALLFHFDWKLPEGMVAEEMDMTEAVAVTAPPRFILELLPLTRLPVLN